MTREERERIRAEIDQAARARLSKQEARLHRKRPGKRAPYWQTYYWENRERILAARATRKAVA